jgi:hypothetical protein
MQVLERPVQTPTNTSSLEVITAESVAAVVKELAAMTPAQRDALRNRIFARAAQEQRRRDDYALHLQIKANPQHWL